MKNEVGVNEKCPNCNCTDGGAVALYVQKNAQGVHLSVPERLCARCAADVRTLMTTGNTFEVAD